MDANTPICEVASPDSIEKMWKERFGLLLSPLQKLHIYLEDYQNWTVIDDKLIYHYQKYPEYTYHYEHIPDNDSGFWRNQEYLKGEVGYIMNQVFCRFIKFYYHQTLIWKEVVVNFGQYDRGKSDIVLPKQIFFKGGNFYYYLTNSLEYKFQNYLVSEHRYLYSDGVDRSKNLNLTNDGKCTNNNFSIPVFQNEDELNNFIKYGEEHNIKISRHCHTLIASDGEDAIFNEGLVFYDQWKSLKKYKNL